jgi:hypothetical protein
MATIRVIQMFVSNDVSLDFYLFIAEYLDSRT